MMDSSVKVKCKNCGRMANSAEFTLDPYFRTMVCQNCIKDRRAKDNPISKVLQKKPAEAEREDSSETRKSRPAGWDNDDDYLEKAVQKKRSQTVQTERIDDENVRYKCPRCSYQFKLNTVTRRPSRCPYCSSEISRFIE